MSQSGILGTTGGGTLVIMLTGNSGGAVSPIAGNINVIGSDPISVAGNPGTATLTISVETATDSQLGVVELATNAEAIAGADSANAITAASLAAKLGTQTQYAVPYGNTTSGAVQWTSAGTNGQLVIAATGAAPAFASLTSSDGSITFTAGANSLDLSTQAQWEVVPDANKTLVSGNNYFANNAGGVTFALPATSSVGDSFAVFGLDAGGGWTISQAGGQTIEFGNQKTTTGVGGSLASTDDNDGVWLVCSAANTDFVVTGSIGNITVT